MSQSDESTILKLESALLQHSNHLVVTSYEAIVSESERFDTVSLTYFFAPRSMPIGPILMRRNEDQDQNNERVVKEVQERNRVFRLLISNAEELFMERDEFLWGAR